MKPTTSTPAALVQRRPLPPDRHPAAVYLAGLGVGSRRTMRSALNRFAAELTTGQCDAETLAWAAVRYQHVAAVRARLAETLAPSTVNKTLCAIRGVARAAWDLRQLADADYQRIAAVRGVKGRSLPAGRMLKPAERAKLYGALPQDAGGARDAALLAVLDGCGLRRAEAVALDVADVDLGNESLTVRRGKGRVARIAPLTNGAADAVRDWLAVRGEAAGPLLCVVAKGGRIDTAARLSAEAAYQRLARIAKQAGVAKFSPHDLRRTGISELLDAGADLSVVSAWAGHKNVATTARYDLRGEAAKRAASMLRSVPYQRQPRRSMGARTPARKDTDHGDQA